MPTARSPSSPTPAMCGSSERAFGVILDEWIAQTQRLKS